MVVADGMGGTGAGEAASHLAIATLVHLVRHFGKWNLRVDDAIAAGDHGAGRAVLPARRQHA